MGNISSLRLRISHPLLISGWEQKFPHPLFYESSYAYLLAILASKCLILLIIPLCERLTSIVAANLSCVFLRLASNFLCCYILIPADGWPENSVVTTDGEVVELRLLKSWSKSLTYSSVNSKDFITIFWLSLYTVVTRILTSWSIFQAEQCNRKGKVETRRLNLLGWNWLLIEICMWNAV